MKLALGTAQFGLEYGMHNHSAMDDNEIKKILNLAKENKIRMIDTAPAYGYSEEKIGKAMSNETYQFKIITKTPHFQSSILSDDDVKHFRETFLKSLQKLNMTRVYGLMVHNIKDMFKQKSELIYNEMLSLKKQGFIDKIGFSIYEGHEIDELLFHYDFDFIQLPINVLDQRLLKNGYLQKLKNKGIEVHARSVFLQGLLLTEMDQIPPQFKPILPLLSEYQQALSENNQNLLEGALNFVKGISQIDQIIVGVNNANHLKQIVSVYHKSPKDLVNYFKFSCSDEKIIDPRNWGN